MYRSSPLRSTFNTNVITGLGMSKLCTGATHNPPRTESVLTVYQTDINTWFTLGRTVETAHHPPRTETVLTVYKKDINTLFTLGSTCEKMRADRGSEGTTTTTTRTTDHVRPCVARSRLPVSGRGEKGFTAVGWPFLHLAFCFDVVAAAVAVAVAAGCFFFVLSALNNFGVDCKACKGKIWGSHCWIPFEPPHLPLGGDHFSTTTFRRGRCQAMWAVFRKIPKTFGDLTKRTNWE